MSVRVVAPCRLHFGLFHVPVDGLTHHPDGRPVRKFGGLGLMIENPCVTVTAEPAETDRATGPLADRALQFLQTAQQDEYLRQSRAEGRELDTRFVIHADGPPEHVGHGVGTALGLAVASVLLRGYWRTLNFPIEAAAFLLAPMVGRGKRSGIGIEGFDFGGFISDDGKLDDEPRQHCTSLRFPLAWRILIVRPPTPPVWFGDRERTAFARTRSADKALSLTERLRSLAYDTVVPAVRDADFDTFAQSIFEFNRLAGEPFHDDQGGPYASPEVACVLDDLMEMGAVGVGQSSWGPTVFAFARDADEAEHLAKRARDRFSSATEVTVTAANNTGAKLTTDSGEPAA